MDPSAKILAARHLLRPGKERQPNHGRGTCPASDKQFHREFSGGGKVIADVPKNDLNISNQLPLTAELLTKSKMLTISYGLMNKASEF